MSQTEKCCQCLLVFTISKMPRKLPTCDHNICQPCLGDIIDTQQEILVCGFCSAQLSKEQIKVFPLNTSILLSEQPSLSEKRKEGDEEELFDCLIEGKEETREQTREQELCNQHKVALDIICISDRQRICPHCALFGQHRDHRFKRVEDFEREIDEKSNTFKSIVKDKQSKFKSNNYDIDQLLKENIQRKKEEIIKQVAATIQMFIAALRKKEESIISEMDSSFNILQQNLKKSVIYTRYQKIKNKFQKWERQCQQSVSKIEKSKRIEDKLAYYYESPLEIVTEGYLYIEELSKYNQQAIKKSIDKISDARLLIDSEMIKTIDGCLKVTKASMSPSNSRISSIKPLQQELTQINQFLDCTSSEIGAVSQSVMLRSSSIDADMSIVSNSCRQILPEPAKLTKKSLSNKPEAKSLKNIEIDKGKTSMIVKKTSMMSPRLGHVKNRASQIISIKSPTRVHKSPSVKEILPETATKPFDLKQPEKIYAQFSKNTLTDFFDISECNLPSDTVVEYVHRARRIHKIKGLKLSANRLTTAGFEKMTEFLQGVCNINLANNQVNQHIFDVIIKNRERMESLRVLNLAHNPINFDKKSSAKLEEVKRQGIIIVL